MKAQEDMLICESHFGGLAWLLVMIGGEFANFIAYIYAPAVLVTPLGALSIIVSAVLAHFLLKEKLRKMGILGCILCIVGSTVIVLHAPGEHSISSVEEIWELAIQPASAVAVVLVLVLYCEPRYGQTNIMIYIGVCSVIGSLTCLGDYDDGGGGRDLIHGGGVRLIVVIFGASGVFGAMRVLLTSMLSSGRYWIVVIGGFGGYDTGGL
ncbi:hypothetical protein RJ639_038396 [Escallonia herrerae]|uniref:Probable magnesium transporter n=1 Tax=Escallonia herrerae TaxID=1293975 RepID=A0AA88WMT1_9ASTE|nr:hypothetical protein RJ639_038396 [Escallonia herrerae]